MPDKDVFEQGGPYTLDEAAITDHEMFMAWRRAGFTEDQAFILLRDSKHIFAMQAAVLQTAPEQEDDL